MDDNINTKLFHLHAEFGIHLCQRTTPFDMGLLDIYYELRKLQEDLGENNEQRG